MNKSGNKDLTMTNCLELFGLVVIRLENLLYVDCCFRTFYSLILLIFVQAKQSGFDPKKEKSEVCQKRPSSVAVLCGRRLVKKPAQQQITDAVPNLEFYAHLLLFVCQSHVKMQE